MSLGLPVVGNGKFMKCLKISAGKPYVKAMFYCSGTG